MPSPDAVDGRRVTARTTFATKLIVREPPSAPSLPSRLPLHPLAPPDIAVDVFVVALAIAARRLRCPMSARISLALLSREAIRLCIRRLLGFGGFVGGVRRGGGEGEVATDGTKSENDQS